MKLHEIKIKYPETYKTLVKVFDLNTKAEYNRRTSWEKLRIHLSGTSNYHELLMVSVNGTFNNLNITEPVYSICEAILKDNKRFVIEFTSEDLTRKWEVQDTETGNVFSFVEKFNGYNYTSEVKEPFLFTGDEVSLFSKVIGIHMDNSEEKINKIKRDKLKEVYCK